MTYPLLLSRLIFALLMVASVPALAGTVQSDNLTPYNEAAVSWPGQAASKKPLVVAQTVRRGVAVAPVKPFGGCYFIDFSPEADARIADTVVSFATEKAWKDFLAAPPKHLTVVPCCLRASVDNPCGNAKKILPTDRVGAIKIFAYGTDYTATYKCQGDSQGAASWQLIAEQKISECYGTADKAAPSEKPLSTQTSVP